MHKNACVRLLSSVFHQQILGFHNQKTRLILQPWRLHAISLSLYTQLYIRTLLPRKQGAASAKTKRWFVTNKHGGHCRSELERWKPSARLSRLAAQCARLRPSPATMQLFFQLPGGKTWQKKQIFSKFNQHFQSFTHLLGANSRCYWEQIGTSNHTKRPWHPSAWCQSFLLFPPPFACVWTSARAHVLMSASPMDSHQGLYIDNWI